MNPRDWPSLIEAAALPLTCAWLALTSGCSATLPPSPPAVVAWPAIPPLPENARPPQRHSQTYSERVEGLFDSWDEMLTKRSPTSSSAPGGVPQGTTP